MKKLALRILVIVCCMSFMASAVYAVCWYPTWVRTEYWQYHSSCGSSPCPPWTPTVEYWSLDGECYTDCDGVTTCEGDTEVRSRTYTVVERGQCAAVCE